MGLKLLFNLRQPEQNRADDQYTQKVFSNKVSNPLNTFNFPSFSTTTAEELARTWGWRKQKGTGILRLEIW